MCPWMPGADDFLEAFGSLGYKDPSSASAKRKRRGKGGGKLPDQQTPFTGPMPQLAHLTLLLRLLDPICRLQVRGSGALSIFLRAADMSFHKTPQVCKQRALSAQHDMVRPQVCSHSMAECKISCSLWDTLLSSD